MLRQRVVTAVIAAVVVFAAVLLGPSPWRVLVTAGCLVGAYEFSSMMKQSVWSLASVWAYIIVAVLIWWPGWFHPFLVQAMVGVTLLIAVITKNRVTVATAASVLCGALYIGFGGASLAALRAIPHGLVWLTLVMFVIWATDIGAYFAGSRLQGPKLWPTISPNKTVSGAVAGAIAGGLVAVIVGSVFLHGRSPWWFLLLGLLVSIVGQLGDLVESAYKRAAGVKDSGNLLPGHGGVLDRVDSLLFAAPLAIFIITR